VNLDDPRWVGLEGGYRVPFDPRPLLVGLTQPGDHAETWAQLWTGLYHQGDVGTASYAAVPPIVDAECSSAAPDWNAYAFVASIDLARDGFNENPALPDWLLADHVAAIERLGRRAAALLATATDPTLVRALLGAVALWKGARPAARLLTELDDSEIAALELPEYGRIFPERDA
jgi:hypothetical protein